ncbi:hypothetical protein [Larkinella punicea]|uniref:T9SS C-terminal target domain-containing protein n=1 Tax=Larkinella punicea TaxID=2315727 RepID=A0A368JT61_9BACT|nr:hypothetical protein [Larkinella punicea]RCR70525.1 hypothetical protein DUE52_06130 [Larkinella punicea]
MFSFTPPNRSTPPAKDLPALLTEAPSIQPQIAWQKNWGGSGDDGAAAITATADGGYVVAGQTLSNDGDIAGNHGSSDGLVFRVNSAGTVVWKKVLGGSGEDQFLGITGMADGGFVVTGITYSNDGDVSGNHGSADLWVVRLTGGGDIVWKKTLGGSAIDWGFAITIATDGGIVVAGRTHSTDGDPSGFKGGLGDFWIVKLTDSGTIVWQKTLGGSIGEEAFAITATSDGGVVAVGYTFSNNGDVTDHKGSTITSDFWVVKLNSTGGLVWQKSFGGSGEEYARSITKTADGGFLVAGRTESNDYDVSGNHGSFDFWVIKITSTGNLVWQKTLGGSAFDEVYGIVALADGGCVVAGHTSSNNGDVIGYHGNQDTWVARLAGDGTLAWQKPLGGSGSDGCRALALTADHGYLLAGSTNSTNGDVVNNRGNQDAWVVKLLPPPLAMLAPVFDCQTGDIRFQTSGGDGTPIEYFAAGVTVWTTNPSQKVESGVLLDPNTTSLTLLARQSGQVVSYPFNFRPLCSPPLSRTAYVGQRIAETEGWGLLEKSNEVSITASGLPPGVRLELAQIELPGIGGIYWVLDGTPTTAVGSPFRTVLTRHYNDGRTTLTTLLITVIERPQTPLRLLAPLFNCQTRAITFVTSGGDGSPIEYSAAGVTPWTTNPNQFVEAGVVMDPNSEPLLIQARQRGNSVSYVFDLHAFCHGEGTGLKLLTPLFDCKTGGITFRTSGGDGTPIEYFAAGVTVWTSNPNQKVEPGVLLDPNTTTLTLQARQSGQTVSYTFPFRSICTAPIAVTAYVGQPIWQATSDGTGYWGVYDPSGTVSVSIAGFPPGVYLELAQVELPGNGGIYWVLGGGPSSTAGSPFRATITRRYQDGQVTLTTVLITVLEKPLTIQSPLYTCVTGELTIKYSGGSGTPVEYMVPGLQLWQSSPSFTVPEWIRNDQNAQPLQLMVRQNGKTASLAFNFRSYCTSAARTGLPNPEGTPNLQVNLLGNPVRQNIVAVVTGAEGQSLQIKITDVNGREMVRQQIEKAQATEKLTLPVAGNHTRLLMLEVATPFQRRLVRVLVQ